MFSQDFVFYHLLARMNAAFFTQCSAYNPLYFIFFLSEQFKIIWQVPNDSLAMNQIFLSLLVIYLCKKLILRALADELTYGTSETNLLTSCTTINYSCRLYYRLLPNSWKQSSSRPRLVPGATISISYCLSGISDSSLFESNVNFQFAPLI